MSHSSTIDGQGIPAATYAICERDTMYETLIGVQKRCTELVMERRELSVQAAGAAIDLGQWAEIGRRLLPVITTMAIHDSAWVELLSEMRELLGLAKPGGN